MANYASNYNRGNRRRRKRLNPFFLIGILTALLAVLVVVAIFISLPRVNLQDMLTVEAGSVLPNAEAFLADTKSNAKLSYAADYSALLRQPGDHKITISWGSGSREVTLRVVDTVAPQGVTQDLLARPDNLPKAEDFLTRISDASTVTVTYQTAPDTGLQSQTVVLLLTDAGGNQTSLTAQLTLDGQAPVIAGAKDIVVYQGNAVTYRTGITVTDDLAGAAPTWQVDSSKVDLSTPGTYPVVYTATDTAGNTSSVTITVTVLEKKDTYVDLDVIYAAVDDLLAEIITPDMDLYRQVHKVYYWIRTNCTYSSKYNFKDDWRQAGYMMLTGRYGDCFYYFGLCKLMLERLGIPNIDVKKVPNYEGDSNHYWHLVSIDGGQTYYHVDTTPRTVATYFCLVTDKEMDDFSASYRNCFNRDKSLYPATPTERPR